ncbi:MAG TPA: hypothetical protein VIA08_04545 [Nitrososphaeraceae archaeon]
MSGIPIIETLYSETYKRINVAGIFGGIIAGGLEAIIYSEERRAEGILTTQPVFPNRMTLRRTVESQLLIDPLQMRSIHQWLGQQIAEYERVFDHIPSPEEIDSRTRRNPNQ